MSGRVQSASHAQSAARSGAARPPGASSSASTRSRGGESQRSKSTAPPLRGRFKERENDLLVAAIAGKLGDLGAVVIAEWALEQAGIGGPHGDGNAARLARIGAAQALAAEGALSGVVAQQAFDVIVASQTEALPDAVAIRLADVLGLVDELPGSAVAPLGGAGEFAAGAAVDGLAAMA